MREIRESLISVSNAAGEPLRHLALAAEGNISYRLENDSMLIKASGCSLATLTDVDLVVVDRAVLRPLLDDPVAGDDEVMAGYLASVREGAPGRRPSVEAILHSVLFDLTDAMCILHTHPIAVNQILCSSRAEAITAGALFPDQIVMLGQHQVLVPYVDPGLPLARAVRTAVTEFMHTYGETPRVVYLRNHGVFVLAPNPQQALAMTEMAAKVGSVLAGALAVGEPVYLPESEVARIEDRPDEHFRRRMLAGKGVDDE
jgi:rhamnose utilization protein RhaD (predicted bifunctional aldolase and dehydrogenase)